jgi:hypothetical protein
LIFFTTLASKVVLLQTQPTHRPRQKKPHAQKAVDEGRAYLSRLFQVEL